MRQVRPDSGATTALLGSSNEEALAQQPAPAPAYMGHTTTQTNYHIIQTCHPVVKSPTAHLLNSHTARQGPQVSV